MVYQDSQRISNQLKIIRESLNMTQLEMAKKAGLTQASISNYEEGTRIPSLKALEKIAKGLGLSIDSLLWDVQGKTYTDKDVIITAIVSKLKLESKEKLEAFYRFLCS